MRAATIAPSWSPAARRNWAEALGQERQRDGVTTLIEAGEGDLGEGDRARSPVGRERRLGRAGLELGRVVDLAEGRRP